MPKDLNQRAKEVISSIPYITIATISDDATPWNSPVFAAYDENYNFYFGTHKGSQKALNINSNPHVFLVIFDSRAEAGTGEGVYLKATAEAVSNSDEIQKAHKLLWDRHIVPYWKLEEFGVDSPLVLYKVTPQKVWMNDEGRANGHYIDTRSEVIL
jgi:general stress protein 26